MPDKEAFEEVCAELESGQLLTLSHVGRVFGSDFWEMIVLCFMDANDAARAIQNAMLKLSATTNKDN